MDAGGGVLEIVETEMYVAFVSGLLVLLGGFGGAFLARRTDYEKWLRQVRSQSFADFLMQAQSFQTRAIDISHTPMPSPKRDIAVTELFMNVEMHKQIVRLYLDPQDRDLFEELVAELKVAMNPNREQGERSGKFDHALKEIQSIFEAALDSYHTKFWNRVFA